MGEKKRKTGIRHPGPQTRKCPVKQQEENWTGKHFLLHETAQEQVTVKKGKISC